MSGPQQTQRYNIPNFGKSVTKGMSNESVLKMNNLYGLSNGSDQLLGKELESIGSNLINGEDLYQVFDVNNPFQVGARQFDTSGEQMKSVYATRTASTTFAGFDQPVSNLIRSPKVSGK